MGKGSQNKLKDLIEPENSKNESNAEKPVYTWAEVRKHNKKNDCWIVINNLVYNVTNFQKQHPGGSRLFHLYAGQDASEVFNAFHKEFDKVSKYSKLYLIGQIDANESKLVDDADDIKQRDLELEKIKKEMEIRKDFEEIRRAAINMVRFEFTTTLFNSLFLILISI
jgi:cytochrome b involved in lipid metabolism